MSRASRNEGAGADARRMEEGGAPCTMSHRLRSAVPALCARAAAAGAAAGRGNTWHSSVM
jgi:hypothetical protein